MLTPNHSFVNFARLAEESCGLASFQLKGNSEENDGTRLISIKGMDSNKEILPRGMAPRSRFSGAPGIAQLNGTTAHLASVST